MAVTNNHLRWNFRLQQSEEQSGETESITFLRGIPQDRTGVPLPGQDKGVPPAPPPPPPPPANRPRLYRSLRRAFLLPNGC